MGSNDRKENPLLRDPNWTYGWQFKLICLAVLFVSAVLLMTIERANLRQEREDRKQK